MFGRPVATLQDAVRREACQNAIIAVEPAAPTLLSQTPLPSVDAFVDLEVDDKAGVREGHAVGPAVELSRLKDDQCVDHGVCMLEMDRGSAIPAVVWSEATGGGRGLVLYVPDAPIAGLEQALCHAHDGASLLERRTYSDKGEAQARIELRRQLAARVCAIGAGAFDTAVLSGKYVVRRLGAAAFLRLRAPDSAGEWAACAVYWQGVWGRNASDGRVPHDGDAAAATSSSAGNDVTFRAIFESSGRSARQEAAFVETFNGACQQEDTVRCVAHLRGGADTAGLVAAALFGVCPRAPPAWIRSSTAGQDGADGVQGPQCAGAEVPQIASVHDVARLPTLGRVLGQCAPLARLRLLAAHGDTRVALATLFVEADRLWSTHALGLGQPCDPARGDDPDALCAMDVVRAVAGRVSAPQAVLMIGVARADECVCSAELRSAAGCTHVTIDAVVRLLCCPWVQPVVLRDSAPTQFCCVDVCGVARDQLTLSTAIRKSMQPVPQFTEPLATAGDVSEVRVAFDARLSAIERALRGGCDARTEAARKRTRLSEQPEQPETEHICAVAAALQAAENGLVQMRR